MHTIANGLMMVMMYGLIIGKRKTLQYIVMIMMMIW